MSKLRDYPLSEVAEFSNGFAFKSEDLESSQGEGYIPIVKMGHIVKGGGFNKDYKTQFVPSDKCPSIDRFGARFGDILMCMTDMKATLNLLAYSALFNEEAEYLINQRVGRIRPKFGVNGRYLYYYLNTKEYVDRLRSTAVGGVQTNLATSRIRASVVYLPDLKTLDNVANCLSAYDDLIENNRRRMALLEESARQLYREWFVRLRSPGYEHTRITKGVPEKWKRIPTPEAVDINPPTKLSDEFEHWTVEMADLPLNNMVIQNATRREGRSGSKFMNGDTLFARITPCLENGKTAFVDFLEEGVVARGSTEFIVLRSRRLTPEFVYCLARTYDFRENAIKSMVGSSGRQRVQESCFEKFLTWIPPDTILDIFTEIVQPLFRQVKTLHAQNQKLRAARDLLLPRLMSGEIPV